MGVRGIRVACPGRDSEDCEVAAAKQGNAAALAAIYEQHRASVYDLAFSLTGSPDDAEDVRQMTFLRAFRALGRFRGESSLRTWLLRICLNVARSARRRQPCSSCPDEGRQVDPSDEAHRRLRAEEVRRRVGMLPRWAAELVALFDLQGFSYREAAGVLGCSAKGIGPRLHRARKLLRRELEDLV